MWFRKDKEINIINLSSTTRTGRFTDEVKTGQPVKIYIHPFYGEDDSKYGKNPGMKEYRQARDCSLQDLLRAGRLLVIVESIDGYKQLQSRLARLYPKANVYTFITPPDDPTPLDPVITQNKPFLEMLRQKMVIGLPVSWENQCWSRFARLLSFGQIMSAELGGQCLIFFDKEDYNDPQFGPELKTTAFRMSHPTTGKLLDNHKEQLTLIPGLCAGIAATELLLRGVNVSLTLPAWPNKMRRDTLT